MFLRLLSICITSFILTLKAHLKDFPNKVFVHPASENALKTPTGARGGK